MGIKAMPGTPVSERFRKGVELESRIWDQGYYWGRKEGFHKGLAWAVLAMFGCVVVGIVTLWLVGPLWLTTN